MLPRVLSKWRAEGVGSVGTERETSSQAMEEGDLETMLKATLKSRELTVRNVRDALVDYYGLVGRRFVAKGLQHTDPHADDALVRRLLVERLALLWKTSNSPWDKPDLRDLARLRIRIEQWSCCRADERYVRLRSLMDELFLAAAVAQGILAVKARTPARKLELINGGAELSPPRGRLRILRNATTNAVRPPSLDQPSSSPSSSSSVPESPL